MNKRICLIANAVFLLIACNTGNRQSKFKDGDFYVLADTNELGLIQGPATFYNEVDKPVKRVNYSEGIKNGPSVNYYENGRVKDSVSYVNGREIGFWYRFDSTGTITSREFFYYGKQLGHQEFYDQNGTIRNYFFTDFEKNDNVFAKYDSQGKLYKIDPFMLQFLERKSIVDGKQMINVFSYLPRPPYCDVKFQIGVTKNKNESEKLFDVNNAIFIDTLLPKLDSNWTYNISCHIRQPNGSFNRVYIEEYGKR